MGVVTSKRPRRLVLAAAVIALAAALFVAIAAPLRAQDEPRITIKVDHKNYFVTGDQLRAAADVPPQVTQTNSRGDQVPVGPNEEGTSLDALLTAAKAPPKTKLVELTTTSGATVFSKRKGSSIVFFWDETRNRFTWIENGGPLDHKQTTRAMTLLGQAGNELSVHVDADPKKPKVGQEVTFTADVEKGLNGETFTYDWNFGDGDEDADAGDTVTHSFSTEERFTVTVTVRGDKESAGVGEYTFRAGKKPKPPKNDSKDDNPAPRNPGPATPPDPGPPAPSPGGTFTPPAGSTPSTPALPPPSTSPPSDPGRGPNLDPNAPPSAELPSGEEVQGILVSTSTPPRPGQAGSKAPNAQAKQAKNKDDEFDWKLAGGIALTALLVILGAWRERVRLHRLLPSPRPQPQSG